MSFFRQALTHPQQLWLRRLTFQIHLWTGILLALYAIVIGVSGSILVFGSELDQLGKPNPWPQIDAFRPSADLNTVIDHLRLRYPHTHIISLMTPTETEPVFTAVLQKRKPATVVCHSITGEVLDEIRPAPSRLSWVYDLHENLLAKRTGRVVNGTASASLVLLALTGLVNWWPGIQSWRRGLKVDLRRKWKRVIFDLHSAVGFWSFLFLILWGSTGVYFTWPDKVVTLISRVSPIESSRPPAIIVDSNAEPVKLDFDAILASASVLDRSKRFKGVIFPSSRRSPLQILMSPSSSTTRDHEDTLYFNPYTGHYISMWRYGANETLGDWIIWLQVPMHFGTHWGLTVKVLWAALGLALPVLSTTGILMYWNRVLSKKWNRLGSA